MTDTLEPGESVDLDFCVDGGPVFERDELTPDTFRVSEHGDKLLRGEVRRLAEAAGFDVTDPDD